MSRQDDWVIRWKLPICSIVLDFQYKHEWLFGKHLSQKLSSQVNSLYSPFACNSKEIDIIFGYTELRSIEETFTSKHTSNSPQLSHHRQKNDLDDDDGWFNIDTLPYGFWVSNSAAKWSDPTEKEENEIFNYLALPHGGSYWKGIPFAKETKRFFPDWFALVTIDSIQPTITTSANQTNTLTLRQSASICILFVGEEESMKCNKIMNNYNVLMAGLERLLQAYRGRLIHIPAISQRSRSAGAATPRLTSSFVISFGLLRSITFNHTWIHTRIVIPRIEPACWIECYTLSKIDSWTLSLPQRKVKFVFKFNFT